MRAPRRQRRRRHRGALRWLSQRRRRLPRRQRYLARACHGPAATNREPGGRRHPAGRVRGRSHLGAVQTSEGKAWGNELCRTGESAPGPSRGARARARVDLGWRHRLGHCSHPAFCHRCRGCRRIDAWSAELERCVAGRAATRGNESSVMSPVSTTVLKRSPRCGGFRSRAPRRSCGQAEPQYRGYLRAAPHSHDRSPSPGKAGAASPSQATSGLHGLSDSPRKNAYSAPTPS